MGSDYAVDRRDPDKIKKVLRFTNEKGCSVILDCVGASEYDNVF